MKQFKQEVTIAEEGHFEQDDDVMATFYLDEKEIKQIAEDELEMVSLDDVDPYSFSDAELIPVLENRGYKLGRGDFYYPFNSIEIAAAYGKLLDNIGNIPLEEINKLTNKYNCI